MNSTANKETTTLTRATALPSTSSAAGRARTCASPMRKITGAAVAIPSWRAMGEAVPILLYHVIGDRPPGAPFPQLYVPAAVFAAQMNELAHLGDHVVTLQELYDHWHGAPLPSKPVVVSFDDGFRNQYTRALPTLRRHGWEGTLNLILAHLHEGSYGLGPREVAHMIDDGWEVDSHTLTHPNLTSLGPTQLASEVGGSRHELHALFGIPVNFFCYPGGAYNATVIAATEAAGYAGATTTNPGNATPSTGLYTLPRIHVTAGTSFGTAASEIPIRRSSAWAAAMAFRLQTAWVHVRRERFKGTSLWPQPRRGVGLDAGVAAKGGVPPGDGRGVRRRWRGRRLLERLAPEYSMTAALTLVDRRDVPCPS